MEIKLPSYVTEHWLWSDPVKFQWWILMLEKVAEKDCVVFVKGERKTCKKGQLITTQGELAKLWKTTTPTAQGFLRKLEQKGEVRRDVDASLTQLTILNLEDWSNIRRSSDRELTQGEGVRRSSDGELTQLSRDTSADCGEVRRDVDANLTRTEKEKRKEKESFPPHPLYKEKENKKEKELRFTDVNLCRQADADDEEGGIDFKKLLAFFNEKMNGKMIPQVRAIIGKRRQAVLARSKEYGKTAIMTAILNAADSEFLNGGNERAFVASFDWIFRPNNFPKVLENNYANKIIPTQQNGTTQRTVTTSAEAKQRRQNDMVAHIFTKLARGQNSGPTEGD